VSGRVTQSRRIERAGVNALRALLEDHDQIVQEIDGGNDYGEDLFVMLTKDGERTGVAITIQVKSGNKYKRAHSYAIPVEGHANDWKNGLLTVLGVVFDVATKPAVLGQPHGVSGVLWGGAQLDRRAAGTGTEREHDPVVPGLDP
jgi:hypothetical protein